jgi:hypothetical protein
VTGAAPADRPLPILDNYLRYTYKRLVMENKVRVTPDGERAAFNTGLLTPHAEEIFGPFERNRQNCRPAHVRPGRRSDRFWRPRRLGRSLWGLQTVSMVFDLRL